MSQSSDVRAGPSDEAEWADAFEGVLEQLEDDSEPRQQHYGFAHMAMPSIFLSNPHAALRKLVQEGNVWLRAIWEDCASRVPEDQRVSDPAPTVRAVQRKGYVIALITMPPPQATTEAHYLACVGGVKRKWLIFPALHHRYFTLEKSLGGTIVGEWVGFGHHSLVDDAGVPVQEEAFLAWVDKHW